MKRWLRRLAFAGGGLILLLSFLAVSVTLLVRNSWFQDFVRKQIVGAIQRSTGAQVEAGSIRLSWTKLQLSIQPFALRGSERPDRRPLFRAERIDAEFRLGSFTGKRLELASLTVSKPEINLYLAADGSLNLPLGRPEERGLGKSPLAGVLDVAAQRFRVSDGMLVIESRKIPLDLTGERLHAEIHRDGLLPRLLGEISVEPFKLSIKPGKVSEFNARLSFALDQDSFEIKGASLWTRDSRLDLSGLARKFSAPSGNLHFNGRADAREWIRYLPAELLRKGSIQIRGDGKFDPSGYAIAGEVAATDVGLNLNGRPLDGMGLTSKFAAVPGKIEMNGLTIKALGGMFSGRAAVARMEALLVEGKVEGIATSGLAALEGQLSSPWDGSLSGPVRVTGRLRLPVLRNFSVETRLTVSPRGQGPPVEGLIEARFDGARDTLDVGSSYLALPSSRLSFSGTLRKQIALRLESSDLEDLRPLLGQNELPLRLRNGSARFEGLAVGDLDAPHLEGRISIRNFVAAGREFSHLAGDVSAEESSAQFRDMVIDLGGAHARLDLKIGLKQWKAGDDSPLSGSASIQAKDVQELLRWAGQKDLDVRGALAGTVQFTGKLASPRAAVSMDLQRGSIYGEPFERIDAQLDYSPAVTALRAGHITTAAGLIEASGSLSDNRQLEFHATSRRFSLAGVRAVQQWRAGAGGTLEFTFSGAGVLPKAGAKDSMLLTRLDSDLTARSLDLDGKPLGDIRLTSQTSGKTVRVHLESNAAKSEIRGIGEWQLEGEYPGKGEISFTHLTLSPLRPWLALPKEGLLKVDGLAEGKISFAGPAFKPAAWKASLEVSRLEASTFATGVVPETRVPLKLSIAEPLRCTLDRFMLRIQSAQFVGTATNLRAEGTISLQQKSAYNLRVKGEIDLSVLSQFDRNLAASGAAQVDVSIRGTISKPELAGKLAFDNGAFSFIDLPNGLSKASGSIRFDQNRVTIENLTADTGGGKVTMAGFVGFGGELVYRLQAKANQVRVRYPEGVSTALNADLNLVGTEKRSLLSGAISVARINFNPRTDFGSLLAKSAQPVSTGPARTGLLGGMQFDVRIDTAADAVIESALARDIQADANLRLRGTISNPVLLGRVSITQGEISFFGTKYQIDQGTISFLNPVKLEPVVNLDVQTRVRGVDVILTFTGPINKLSVSHRSDPPLEFSDVIALLATGRDPNTSPTVAARQSAQQQSWQQIGGAALVGQAITSPVTGRLQRFFGVSKVKIDPQLSGIENNPQARLTVEQQVTKDLTFTYITNLSRTNQQTVRIEWVLNKRWSVHAVRDENGLFGLDFFYRKRFR